MPDWLICYLANSGLQMHSFLQAAVIAACSRAAEPGANTRNNDALMLANPDIRRAFAICEENLARHLAALGESTVA